MRNLSHPHRITLPPKDDVNVATLLLKCPVCEDLLTDPVTLSCGNTVCQSCLPPFDPATVWKFVCPVTSCSRKSHLFGDIKVDVTLHKLVDIVHKESEKRRKTSSSSRSNLARLESDNEDDEETEDEDEDAAIMSDEDEDANIMSDEDEDANIMSDEDEDANIMSDDDYDDASGSEVSWSSATRSESTTFKDMLVGELECQVCYLMYYEPITTPCGHTFCKSCLLRTIDHSTQCPLCRHQLPGYPFFHSHAANTMIQTFMTTLLPILWEERRVAAESELYDEMDDTPIFVCSLVFPKTPCFLHIFEPRYRLMLRRCLESRRRRFGMCLPGRDGQPFHEYGTMLEIRSVEVLPDGRSLVGTVGSHRFRVVERGSRDGYSTGKIERIEDVDPSEEEQMERQIVEANQYLPEYERQLSTAEMITKARAFIDALKNTSAPWLLQRLSTTYGEMPEDPCEFAWWCAALMPVEEFDKYKILQTTTVRDRMLIINGWIDTLREQWWYARGGCNIS
ncbi:PUA-like domain-containing protein [Jimgerdemannia flammicorona]|uniref:PUA-like domain-containing protein n=1 Tax=Jimgerdemannia flammicorona TaxID=994334 RepID=A0A433PGV1_9FUNG|nr:PUA-like domain-containing protein [Jimgerdemannia flammicorona]